MKIIRKTILLGLSSLLLFACVPQKKYADLQAEQNKCKTENATLSSQVIDLQKGNSDLSAKIAKMQKDLDGLKQDTLIQGTTYRQLKDNYDQINKTYQLLLEKNRELLAGNKNANSKLMSQLQLSQADLQKKQDALNALQAELEVKKANLEKKSARVNELESILNKKDSTMKAIKAKIQDALLGFKDQGLTVEQKDGKVYVSLQQKLLFPSGSYEVSSKGVNVLKKLGKVLEQNDSIDIMVVGHTDNVPYKGSGTIKDNWDLSVMRATSVVKIITNDSKVNPKRIVAAGRSEYLPVASNSTAEGRKKNRRIEIILTPKLGELLKILNN